MLRHAAIVSAWTATHEAQREIERGRLIPQAELVLVPRGGHAYAQTEPDEFNRRVHDFFLSHAW